MDSDLFTLAELLKMLTEKLETTPIPLNSYESSLVFKLYNQIEGHIGA